MTDEALTDRELEARAWAILAAVADDRGADVDALLGTLLWSDLVAVVYAIAHVCVEFIAGTDDLTDADRERVGAQVRRILLRLTAEDDDPS